MYTRQPVGIVLQPALLGGECRQLLLVCAATDDLVAPPAEGAQPLVGDEQRGVGLPSGRRGRR